jgi:hypothetical protein
MTTNNKAVTCYLPKDIEDFITGYSLQYGITRKDKEGETLPSLGTGIIELLKLLAYNPELVSSPILDTVPSKFSEDAIEKKIDEILEKKLNSPDTVPSQVTDLEGKVESIILDKLPSIIPEYLPSDLLARIENMERLLRLQREASIASHSPLPPSPPGTDAIASIDGTVTGEGMTAKDAAKYLKTKKVKVSYDSLNRWIKQEKIPDTSPQGKNALKHLILRDKLYYPIN